MKIAQALMLFITLLFSFMATAQERVTLEDGSVLGVFVVMPAETTDDPSTLVVLMGGGPGNASISRDTSIWLGGGFSERGYVVAVPISPNNRAFRGEENNQKVEQLIVELQQRDYIAEGKVLLAGISNGGMSALEIARRNPQNYFGVAAVPALATSVVDNRRLAGFPVYLRIGGADQLGWANRFEETVDALTEAGVDLDAAILDSAPHMFRMNWESLDAWLEKVTQQFLICLEVGVNMKKLTKSLVVLSFVAMTGSVLAGPPATIDQLSWMTGNWAGNLGPNQLEENWISTEGRSLMAAVRMTGADATSMFEVITIEEADGSLVLHIQQWDAGFQPRTEAAQKLELVEITENSVKFEDVSGFGMPTLGYSNPDEDTFVIHVGQPDGNTFDIQLNARSIW